jgi:hypothetical protein
VSRARGVALLALLAACGGDDDGSPGAADAGAGDGGAADAAGPDVALADAAPPDAWSCTGTEKPLPNAGLVEPPGLGGCPPGMAPVDDFCIDRWEASLEGWSPYWNPGATPPPARSIPGAVPQGYISGTQAADACAAAGKRLCTDAEWLRACRGPMSFVYPYGDTRMDGVCNDARAQHPAIEYFGPNDPDVWSKLGHPCINQLPASLDPAGANPGCVTAEGLFDMMGNLHEWTADPAGTFRGGFYVDTTINGNGCLYATTAHNTAHWDYSTGFRCCW